METWIPCISATDQDIEKGNQRYNFLYLLNGFRRLNFSFFFTKIVVELYLWFFFFKFIYGDKFQSISYNNHAKIDNSILILRYDTCYRMSINISFEGSDLTCHIDKVREICEIIFMYFQVRRFLNLTTTLKIIELINSKWRSDLFTSNYILSRIITTKWNIRTIWIIDRQMLRNFAIVMNIWEFQLLWIIK